MAEEDRCNNCGKHATGECPGCRLDVYCSEQCQREAWPAHQEHCDNEVEPIAITFGRRGKLTIPSYLNATRQFRQLHGLLQDADLIGVLSGTGPYTIFAPTNAAISNYEANEKNLNPQALGIEKIMKYHVVKGIIDKSSLRRRSGTLETLAGPGLPYSYNPKTGSIMVGPNIEITRTGVKVTNGMVHRIDGVLVPK